MLQFSRKFQWPDHQNLVGVGRQILEHKPERVFVLCVAGSLWRNVYASDALGNLRIWPCNIVVGFYCPRNGRLSSILLICICIQIISRRRDLRFHSLPRIALCRLGLQVDYVSNLVHPASDGAKFAFGPSGLDLLIIFGYLVLQPEFHLSFGMSINFIKPCAMLLTKRESCCRISGHSAPRLSMAHDTCCPWRAVL